LVRVAIGTEARGRRSRSSVAPRRAGWDSLAPALCQNSISEKDPDVEGLPLLLGVAPRVLRAL